MTPGNERVAMIRSCLQALSPVSLEITDDSHKHAGHAGARAGGGHFSITLVSEAFTGKRSLQRHRMIYAALDTLMQHDIHALSIQAFTPQEVAATQLTTT